MPSICTLTFNRFIEFKSIKIAEKLPTEERDLDDEIDHGGYHEHLSLSKDHAMMIVFTFIFLEA